MDTMDNIKDELQLLRDNIYPRQVDVVADVMRRIESRPLMVLDRHRIELKKFVRPVAVVISLLALAFGSLLVTHGYDEQQMSMDIAYFYSNDYAKISSANVNESVDADYDFGMVELLFDQYDIN